MLGTFKQAVKTLRNVDQQLQQVIDIVHPGPLASSVQRWTPEGKARASKAVERAIDTWYTRHGVSQAPWAGGPQSENLYLTPRLNAPPGNITQPSYLAPWDSKTIYYPRWMFGEWKVKSTFTNVSTPQKKYLPDGFLQEANAPKEDGGVGSSYDYSLRFYSTLPDTFSNNARFMLGLGYPEDAIIADKAYNTKQMTDAFLGYQGAVASVDFDPRDAPLRQTVELSRLGPDMVPLPPRRIELYVNALKSEQPSGDDGNFSSEGKIFVTSELARQVLVAVRDVQITDYEVMNEYRLVAPGKVEGRQRSVLYLQPQDPNYFRAGNRAVAVYDYEFTMTREKPAEDAPQGAIACVETPKDVIQCL